MERLNMEFASTGLSTQHHPMQYFRKWCAERRILHSKQVMRARERAVVETAGMVVIIQAPETAKEIRFITLEDEFELNQCGGLPRSLPADAQDHPGGALLVVHRRGRARRDRNHNPCDRGARLAGRCAQLAQPAALAQLRRFLDHRARSPTPDPGRHLSRLRNFDTEVDLSFGIGVNGLCRMPSVDAFCVRDCNRARERPRIVGYLYGEGGK